MTKKLLTLAAGAMMIAPMTSFADTANVNVYGTLNFSFDIANAVNSPDPVNDSVARWRLISNASNFGIKGEESVSDYLKAFFQVENSLEKVLENGKIANRNTAVGLKLGGSTVLLGQWDSPFKIAHSFAEPFYGAGTGYMVSILDNAGGSSSTTYANAGAVDLSFSNRMGQSIQYWSPKWMGMTVRLMYSGNTSRIKTENPTAISGSVAYEEGPINAAFAFEQHADSRVSGGSAVGSTTATNTKDTGIKAAAGYKLMDTTSINGAFTSLKYVDKFAAGEDSASKTAFLFSLIHQMGDWSLRTGFGFTGDLSCSRQSGAACSLPGTAAKQIALGGSYSLSKRTDVYGLFAKIWNESNVGYNFIHGDVPDATGGTLDNGTDPMSVGIGVRHVF